jgi:hypothetical protein
MASNDGLRVGDVVQIAVQLTGTDGSTFWWKRFAVVTKLIGRRAFEALNLKMHPNLNRDDWKACDHREIHYATDERDRPQVVTKLREPWPQGVAAMHMKLLALRIISIGDD